MQSTQPLQAGCVLTIGHSPESFRGRTSPAAAGLRYRLPARLPLAHVRASSFARLTSDIFPLRLSIGRVLAKAFGVAH